MKRELTLFALAGAAAWGLALIDFTARDRTAPSAEEAQDMPPVAAAAAAHASPARTAHATAPAVREDEPAVASPARPAPADTSFVSSVVRAAQGSIAVIGKAARTLLPGSRGESASPAPRAPAAQLATGELGEGAMSPDYTEAETKYAAEARDGAWADAHEQRVRALLEPQPWGDRVAILSCQQATCRITLDSDAQDPFQQLLRVPGLGAATGIGPGTPYSLTSGQLTVYFKPSEH